MTKLSNLFGRPGGGPIPDIGQRRLAPDVEVIQPSTARNEPMQAIETMRVVEPMQAVEPRQAFEPLQAVEPRQAFEPLQAVDESETVSAADAGSRLGEENEVLRNLLAETERKLGEFDDLKVTFAALLEPAGRALRTLEQEKTRNIGLQRSLNQLRTSHDILQSKFFDLETRAAALESDNQKLQRDVLTGQQAARALTEAKSDLNHELAVARATIAEAERQQQQQANNIKILNEDNQRLRDQTVRADARGGQLETQLNGVRQKLMLLEGDKATLQKSLDKTVSEASRLSQNLTETETTLTATRNRLLNLETRLSEIEPERSRLISELNEFHERARAEQNRANIQFEAVQARAEMAEKLLANTRQLLSSRVEDARVADRRAIEATHGRDSAQKRLNDLEARNKVMAAQLQDLEQSHTKLSERTSGLTATLKTRDAQLSDAEERIRSSSERISRFESDMKIARMSADRRIDELNNTIIDERLERQVLEGALKAARQECSQLQRELSQMRLLRRNPPPHEPVAQPEPVTAISDRSANAA